jgi:PAS domain S-box-containing protein
MYFYDMNSYLSLILLGFASILGWILNRAGHTRSSAVILIVSLLIAIQFNIFAGYGIHDVAIIAWPAFIFFSGLLFGWRVIPYITAIILGLAIATKTIPNDPFFFDYSDTGDLILMLLILLAFSIIAISLLRGNEHLIQHLQRSDERFKAIYNSINDAIFIHDAQTGVILDVNDKMLEMFGYTYREAILLDLLAISSGIPPYTQENAEERIKKAVAEGTQQFEWQVKDKSERLFWVDVNMRCATISDQSQVLVSVRDITERKKADEELLKFKLGIERSADAIFITDPQGVIVYTNPAFERIYGYTQSEAMGRTPRILKSGVVPPDQNQRFWATLHNKDIVAGESINQTKDGRLITIEGSNNPILDAADNIIGFLGVHRDITERKRAEEQVRNSEKRFHALIEHGRDNISLLAADGTLLWESPSVDSILGYAPNKFVRHNIFELMHPDDQAWTSNTYAQVVQSPGNIQEGTFRLLHADSTWRWIECTATNLLNEPSVQAIVINYRDITERKRAEEALQESEEKYRGLVQGSPDAIVIYVDGNIVFANPACAELLRASSVGNLLGRAVIELIHPDYREFVTRRMIAARKEGKMLPLAEEKFIRFDGTAVDVEVKAIPITFEKKSAVQIIARDITERKQRENELQAITSLSAALRNAPTRAEMLPVIVEQLSRLLHCDTISVEIIDPTTNESVIEAAIGAWNSTVGFRQPPGTGVNAIISKTRRPHHNNNIKGRSRKSVSAYPMKNIHASVGIPLIAQDRVIGFLWMGHSKEIAENKIHLLAAIADIAANAIHRATLHEQTQKDAADLARAYDTTLEGWGHALELRDHGTEGHTRRVVQMTLDLARTLGIGEGELENIRRGALLHDIGKMGIPDSILLKPGPLDEREWEIMHQHPEYAYKLLESIEYLHPVLDIPYCHHERWDGSGYPRGLKGEEIPLQARIFAVVDVWDALTSDRPYRLSWSKKRALAYIAEQSRKNFDPAIVEAFLKII